MRKFSTMSVVILVLLSFSLGSGLVVLLEESKLSTKPNTLNVPLTLGNNIRRAYTLRTQEGNVGVVEFATEQGGYCVLALTEVTISGHQSVALDCLEN